ncbi:SDR family NAD(P)-dependent oxidoreductase [Bacillus marinisedimentorum]|uniref:SDR family NAD(P)-dependent oxidoreductase n=1 Tax=Bacillus marinisedimentorum TaxID=1821260 RepID=UPI000872AFBB|nr:SDR family oxidoreductase [Bacillus marinisedimentorum]
MDLHLNGKAVLVTGGSKGIGKAIARRFAEEGAAVGICARDEQELKTASEEIGAEAYFAGDLTDKAVREDVFNSFVSRFGKIDILVNNAGGSNGGTAMETDVELFEEAIQLNFLQAVHLSKLAAAEMKRQKTGAIVNITSIFGRESGGKPTYNASKAAMISFTKAFADECIPFGVRVNGIAPGSILHPTGNWQKRLDENPEKINRFVEEQIPAGRFGTADEIADVAVFLASRRASWVIGATLNTDGGQSKMNF